MLTRTKSCSNMKSHHVDERNLERADYWKSQARKYCDFCKCWIADNKPSIQFHENGKRHKESVAQKLAMLTKRSVKEKKQSLQVDAEMKKMEEAAMQAYMKDVEANPDYTSRVLLSEAAKKKQLSQPKEKQAPKKEPSPPPPVNDDDDEAKEADKGGEAVERLWYEAKSDEGYTYYWNYQTGASVWVPPEEGYVSLEEQNTQAEEEHQQPPVETKSKEDSKDEDHLTAKEEVAESESEEEEEESTSKKFGPAVRGDPYGGWKTVERRVVEPVDLQLPQQEYVALKVPLAEPEQPRVKFKEKTITTLQDDDSGPSTFKKRKFNPNRGNMRRTWDDGDD